MIDWQKLFFVLLKEHFEFQQRALIFDVVFFLLCYGLGVLVGWLIWG